LIASIEGNISYKDDNRVIVDVGGVGVEVFVPSRTLGMIGNAGSSVFLRTYLHVREDTLTLYGFIDDNERYMFELLIGVSGIGPKLALSILSTCEADKLADMIHSENKGSLVRFPGIGRKTAERLILELRDKIDRERFLLRDGRVSRESREIIGEAVSALETLGLKRSEIDRALSRVDLENFTSATGVEELVREVLRVVSESS
jgi:Holliday junction DNA helicase RuvA